MRPIVLLLALIALLIGTAPAQAQIAFVTGQVQIASGDDQTVVFPNPPGNGNVVYVWTRGNSEAVTIDLTGTPAAETVLAGPIDSPTHTLRTHAFCFVGDGVDNSFTVTTSSTGNVQTVAAEFSGGTCTLDGSVSFNDDDATPYNLSSSLTTSTCGSILMALVTSNTVSNYTADGAFIGIGGSAGAATHNSSADFPGGDGVGASLFQYQITVATGTYDTPFTSAANEQSLLTALAVQPTTPCAGAGGGSRGLTELGVG